METKFKVGQKVVCNFKGRKLIRIEGMPDGSIHTVTGVTEDGFIQINGDEWFHSIIKFQPIEPVLIVLRRPEDVNSIMNFAKENGYEYDHATDRGDINKSRVRVLHKVGECANEVTYNAMCPYGTSVKQTIDNTLYHLQSYFGYKPEDVVIVKTKPSVSAAIKEIKKYI
jgi:hypothetical protein